jgi:TM2 domain-containing membrane protein YozV
MDRMDDNVEKFDSDPIPGSELVPAPAPYYPAAVSSYQVPAPVAQTVPAGWYADRNSGRMRWWDGYQWTEAFAPAQAPRAPKDTTVAYLLLIFLGGLGIYHFYLGRTGSGITMLILTLIGAATSVVVVGIPIIVAVWIWVIVDLFLIPSHIREANARVF